MDNENLQRMAERGCNISQNKLARAYYLGSSGLDKCKKKSFYWFKLSAEQGNIESIGHVASAYYTGTGVERDCHKALEWAYKDSETKETQFIIASLHNEDNGDIEKYLDIAIEWYEKSATQGYIHSMRNLAQIYLNGQKEYQNLKKGVFWASQGAMAGDGHCQYCMYVSYYNGWGVKEDLKKAHNWIIKSAKSGFKHSQYNLGIFYAEGSLTEKDLKKSKYWYKQAAKQGMKDPHSFPEYNTGVVYDKLFNTPISEQDL